MTENFTEFLRSKLAEAEALSAPLWETLQRLEQDAKSINDGIADARSAWCKQYNRAESLRKLLAEMEAK